MSTAGMAMTSSGARSVISARDHGNVRQRLSSQPSISFAQSMIVVRRENPMTSGLNSLILSEEFRLVRHIRLVIERDGMPFALERGRNGRDPLAVVAGNTPHMLGFL